MPRFPIACLHAACAGVMMAMLLAAVPAALADEDVATYPAEEDVAAYPAEAVFEDVVLDLENAIINRGLAVDYRGRIGEMLQRTAEDVGAEEQIYDNAEFFQFCSAVLSRKSMEADPRNIAYCPYILFAYEEAGGEGGVTVGYRKLPSGPGRDDVNALLDEIAREAAAGAF